MQRLTAVLLVFVAGCSTGGGVPQSGSANLEPDSGPLTFTTESDRASTGTVTLEDGGTISATAADGTAFELVVPAEAVAEDTEITMTPLADVSGIEANAVHAVHLEPDGLEFYELARLTITPASEIPVADQLMFEADGDGADAGLAMIDPRSEDIVLLLAHFSIGGVGSVTPQQRATFIEKSASNAERRIRDSVRSLQGTEREAQLLGGRENLSDEVLAELERLDAEYQREVVDKRKEAAALSCKALQTYARTVINFENERQLLGASESQEAASLARIAEVVAAMNARFEACEKEAIAECKKQKDPAILVRFWLANERPADEKRAESICEPQGFTLELSGSDFPLRTSSIGTDTTIDLAGRVEGCLLGEDEWSFSGETTITYTSSVATRAPSEDILLDLEGNQTPDDFTVLLAGNAESADFYRQYGVPAGYDPSTVTVTDALGTPTAVLTLYNNLGERVGDFDLDVVVGEPDCEIPAP